MTWTIESVKQASVAASDVYRLYADPATWSVWGHGAKSARAVGPLVEGGTVTVRGGSGMPYACRIRRLVADRVLELEVRPPMMIVIQTYESEPTPEGSRIRHGLEISGPLAGLMRLFRVDRVYQGKLDKEVESVIELAAKRSQDGVRN